MVAKGTNGWLEFRRAVKAALIGVLAVAGALFFQGTASASVKTITTDRQQEAWFWSSNQDDTACTPTAIPGQGYCTPGSPKGSAAAPISPGHLGVSWKAGSSDMRAYIAFDLSFIPPGSTVRSMVTTFTISTNDSSDTEHATEHAAAGGKPVATQSVSGTPALKACVVTVAWGNAEGDPPANRDPASPTNTIPVEPAARKGVDTNNCVDGKPTATTWSFDVTPFAKAWVAGTTFNNGFAILPNPSAPQSDNWTVELHGAYYASAVANPAAPGGTTDQVFVDHKREVTSKVDYIPLVVAPTPTPRPSVVSSSGGSLPSSSGFGGSSAVTPITPAITPPTPAAPPAPKTTQRSFVPVSQTQPGTPGYVWWMIPPALLGWIGLTRAVGMETGEGVTNRVASVLRRRRAAQDESGKAF